MIELEKKLVNLTEYKNRRITEDKEFKKKQKKEIKKANQIKKDENFAASNVVDPPPTSTGPIKISNVIMTDSLNNISSASLSMSSSEKCKTSATSDSDSTVAQISSTVVSEDTAKVSHTPTPSPFLIA